MASLTLPYRPAMATPVRCVTQQAKPADLCSLVQTVYLTRGSKIHLLQAGIKTERASEVATLATDR